MEVRPPLLRASMFNPGFRLAEHLFLHYNFFCSFIFSLWLGAHVFRHILTLLVYACNIAVSIVCLFVSMFGLCVKIFSRSRGSVTTFQLISFSRLLTLTIPAPSA